MHDIHDRRVSPDAPEGGAFARWVGPILLAATPFLLFVGFLVADRLLF